MFNAFTCVLRACAGTTYSRLLSHSFRLLWISAETLLFVPILLTGGGPFSHEIGPHRVTRWTSRTCTTLLMAKGRSKGKGKSSGNGGFRDLPTWDCAVCGAEGNWGSRFTCRICQNVAPGTVLDRLRAYTLQGTEKSQSRQQAPAKGGGKGSGKPQGSAWAQGSPRSLWPKPGEGAKGKGKGKNSSGGGVEKEKPDGSADDGLSHEAPSEADQCRAEIAK